MQTNNGIEIKKDSFDLKIESYSFALENEESLNVEDYIFIVRLYNTIIFKNLTNTDPRYEKFVKLFNFSQIEKTAKILEANESIGMSYYSKKHDIYIGGVPHKNSYYKTIIVNQSQD